MTQGHDARAIANEFFDRAQRDGMRLTNMQLQQLPYIAHGWSLALRDEPIIKDIPQAWRYGPAYPVLRQALRRYGSGNVFEPICENDDDALAFLSKDGRGRVVKTELSPDEALLLDAVWQNYKGYSPAQIAALTARNGTPWCKAKEEYGVYSSIPDDIIREYYTGLLNEVDS